MAGKGALTGKYPHERFLQILCLVLIAVAGIGMRASVWSAWEKTPEHGFYKGLPALRECDGYHYLGLARDLLEGNDGRSGDKSNEPGTRPQSQFPPFLSLLAASVSRATGAPLEWCAAWIPVVLGASAAIPLYLLAVGAGGWVAGVVAGILGTMAPMWVYRSGFAFFDTDCLIVPLILWIAWAALHLRENAWSRVLLFGLAWAALSYLLLWSWDTNAVVVFYLAAVPALLSLLTGERAQNRRKLLLALSAGIILAAALANYGVSGLLQQIMSLSDIIFAHERSPFPNPSVFVSELERHDFEYVAGMASGSVVGFLAGITGLVLVVRNKWREAIILLPLASIGALSFFSGLRFVIFLAPVLAYGTGFLASAVWRRYAASPWRWVVPAITIVLSGLTLINEIPVGVIWPFVHPGVMEGIDAAGELTPENSLIWCGWSVGYPVSYLARRTPVADGGDAGNGQAMVANSIPFATKDFRLSANWIQFYANRGEKGLAAFWSLSRGPGEKLGALKEALAAGPSEAASILNAAGLHEPPPGSRSWKSFLFPQSKRRIFLFLDFALLRSFDGWYRPGTWRPGHLGSETGPYLYFQGVRGMGQSISGQGLEADLQNGIALVGPDQANLSEVFLRNQEHESTRKYRETGPRLEIFLPGGLAVLTLPEYTNSVFHKLFVRHQTDSKYFKPILLHSPLYQIWEVTGDVLVHAGP